MRCYLNDLGIATALGTSKSQVAENLFCGGQPNIVPCAWVSNQSTYIAQVGVELPEISAAFIEEFGLQYKSRNNQLALLALRQIEPMLEAIKSRYAAPRIGVVIGTSTSGIAQAERAVIAHHNSEPLPADYVYQQIELGSVAKFIGHCVDANAPVYAISTACSSSGHALNSAQHLLNMDLADIVIAGGVDSLCRLTVNGFAALESVSDEITNPFSVNRKGITIGEGAALFVVSKEPEGESIELLGVGTSSDAYHISAPQPQGEGAERAIRAALKKAGLHSNDISYVNLHGTGTRLNDAMESVVIERLFGADVPCSSSKGQIGHTLGAAAACEVALCWLALSSYNSTKVLPPHVWDGQRDPALSNIRLIAVDEALPTNKKPRLLSNSFAFGGNNAVVIIGSE